MIYFMSAPYMFFKLFSPAIFSMCNIISFDTLPVEENTDIAPLIFQRAMDTYTIRWQLSACILNIEEFPVTRGFIYIFNYTIH